MSSVRGTNQSIFTISVWVKPSGSAASKAILGKAEELRVATNGSGQPVCQIKSSSTWQTAATSSAAISVGQWSHVSCTYDLAYVRIFVNGVEKGSQALAVAADDTSAVWKIGRDDSASTPYGYFAGQVDEYKFYNSALTPDQIAIDMNQGKVMQLGGQTSATGATGAAAEYCVPGDATSCAPPVGEWKFDEGSGGTVNDTSGNGNTGTWSGTGTRWTVDGKYNNAGKFNGSDDSVGVGTTGMSASSGTWTGWVKNFDSNTTQRFIYGHSNPNRIYVFKSEGGGNNNLYIGLGDNTYNSGWTFDTNVWHYITATWNNGTYFIYVDGNQVRTGAYSGLSGINASANFGTTGGGGGAYWYGLIDQVRIYNYARTPAQIAWDYNRGKPVGWWKMDEGEGDKAYDSSGNNNTGTLTQMDPPNDWVNGKFGKALDFDGSNDYVEAPLIHNGSSYTWTFWTYTTSLRQMWMISADTLTNGWGFGCWDGNGAFRAYSGQQYSRWIGNNGDVKVNEWQYWTVVYNGSGISAVYRNGELLSPSSNDSNSPITGTSKLRIGGLPDSWWSRWTGQIDDVRVYNYALTQEQIKQIMNNGASIRFGE